MAFDIGSIEATLELDRSPFISSLEAAQRAGQDFEGETYTAKLAADSSDVTQDVANARGIVESFDRTKGTAVLDADWQGAGSVAAATGAISAVPNRKTTTLDALNQTLAEAAAATAAINAVPDRKTTELEVRGDAAESILRRTLSLIRQIPGAILLVFQVHNDPHMILTRISSSIRRIGSRVIPIRFQTNASQVDRDLNLIQRSLLRVSSAGARVANAFGRDGSIIMAIGRAFSGLVSIVTRVGSALGSLAGIMGRIAVAAANMVLMMSGSAVTVQQLAQAASGALAGMGGLGAALGAVAAQAAAAAPMLILTAAALAAVAAAVVLISGIIGAFVAALTLLVANLATLVGIAAVVAGGFALIGAAAIKLATDFGRVYSATQRVADAQTALNAARKSGDTERIAEAEKELARAMNEASVAAKKAANGSKEYQQALSQLAVEAGKLKSAFSQAFQGAATEIAQIATKASQLARQVLPQLGQAAEQSVKAMEDGFRRAEGSTDGLKAALQQLPGIMDSVAATVKNLGAAFDGFLQAALPLIQDFVQWCESASKALAEWANSKQGIDQINDALQMAADVAKEVWDGLKQVGEALAELANNHAPSAESAIDMFFDAVSAGIGFLDAMLSAIESICSALSELIQLAGRAAEALQSLGIGSGGGILGGALGAVADAGANLAANEAQHNAQVAGIGRAYGGDVKMASGGTVGAHWVNSFTQGLFSGLPVTYGEALTGDNREYAFPMDDGGTRFITEEPGYDGDSFGLWMDLGERKGWLNSILSGRGSALPSNMGSLTGHGRSIHQVSSIQQGRGNHDEGSRRVETRIDSMEKVLKACLEQVRDATRELPHNIRESVNHNLSFGRATRASVLRGLGRETRRFVFEGSF